MPFRKRELFAIENLTVTGNLPPKCYENLHKRLILTKDRSLSLANKSEPVHASVVLPKRYITPGDNLQILVSVDNSSTKPIKEICATLKLRHSIQAKGRVRKQSKKIICIRKKLPALTLPQNIDDLKLSMVIPDETLPSIEGLLFQRFYSVSFLLILPKIFY